MAISGRPWVFERDSLLSSIAALITPSSSKAAAASCVNDDRPSVNLVDNYCFRNDRWLTVSRSDSVLPMRSFSPCLRIDSISLHVHEQGTTLREDLDMPELCSCHARARCRTDGM